MTPEINPFSSSAGKQPQPSGFERDGDRLSPQPSALQFQRGDKPSPPLFVSVHESRERSRRFQPILMSNLVVIFLLFASTCFAETIRVTTWSLEALTDSASNSASEGAQNRINEAAHALQKLKPDVILLQRVRDWQMCSQLAQALRPASYQVLVCSAFRGPTNTSPGQPQVAILAKRKAYLSWSEPWHPDAGGVGGYAFAAIQTGKHRIGLFSLQMANASAQETSSASAPAQERQVRQWLKTMDACKKWVTNRIEAIVAVGAYDPRALDSDSLRSLETAGFSNPFLALSEEQSATGQVEGLLSANAKMPPGLILDHWPATCDVDLDAPHSVPGLLVRAEPPPAPVLRAENGPAQTVQTAQALETSPPAVSQVTPVPASNTAPSPSSALAAPAQQIPAGWWVAGAIIAMLMVATITWMLSRRRPVMVKKPALLSMTGEGAGAVHSAYTVVVTPHSATGSGERIVSSTSRPLLRVETPRAASSEILRPPARLAEPHEGSATAAMREGVISHLSQWLKEKLVRRLIADRTQLLEMQDSATRKTIEVDQRLARVERQIQQQNQAYERRIIELSRELEAAREGNRELIQAQIAKVKAEMEAARARVLNEASDGAKS